MNLDMFTEKAKAALQAAQTLALRSGHQALEPAHLLKVLTDDATVQALLRGAAVRPEAVRAGAEALIAKLPRVEGGQQHVSTALAKILDSAQQIAQKAGDAFVTTERMLQAILLAKTDPASGALTQAGLTDAALNETINATRKGRTADTAGAEDAFDALEKYAQDITARAAEGQMDPVIGRDEEIRRTIQVLSRRTKNNPVLIGEPGVGKTAIVEGLAQRIVAG